MRSPWTPRPGRTTRPPRTRGRLLGALVAVLLSCAVLVPAPPAVAQGSCAPAGGETITPATPEAGDVRITGGGWGHGAGMSQYGAQGAARLGCDAETILETYYPGAELERIEVPSSIRVSIATNATDVPVEAVTGPIAWETCTDGICSDLERTQAKGDTWKVGVAAEGAYEITSGGTTVFEGADKETLLRARLSLDEGEARIVRVAGTRYRWGLLEFDSVAAESPVMFVTLDVAPVDRYLYGLAEVPASWPTEALEAQAIAGRSYALLRVAAYGGQRESCRCDVYATVRDQAYRGYEQESAGPAWVSAVDETGSDDHRTALVVRYEGEIADTYYSSSHGGSSESAAFVFGAALPYVRPVDDSRWDLASDNPFGTWSKSFSAAEVGQRFGVGEGATLEVLAPVGAACRVGHPSRGYGGVRVSGSSGERVVTGDQVRQILGLRSTLFAVNADADGGGCPGGGPAGHAGGGEAEPAPTATASPSPSPSPTTPPDVEAAPQPAAPSEDPAPSAPPGAGTPTTPPMDPTVRVAGPDRVATAVEVSERHWERSADALLATGASYPDALAAGALAARLDAPLLLTGRDELPTVVAEELRRLGAERVRVLGGTAVVRDEVLAELSEMGLEVERIAGPERYATARAAVMAAGAGGSGEVALASGTGYADAVSAGALTASPERIPTLLTDPGELPQATRVALADLGARRVLVLGGPAAVSEQVVSELRDLGLEVERLAGRDRFGTSAAVATAALQRFEQTPRPVVVATGWAFPDALTAGALAAHLGAPLQLVDGGDLAASAAARALLYDGAGIFDQAVVVGGTRAISDDTLDDIAAAITR